MASKLVTIPSNSMIPERDIDKSPILECINLGIQFGGLKAVDDFNLTIGRTEIAGLIGPNGAGKTTVFNLLTKVYQNQVHQRQVILHLEFHLLRQRTFLYLKALYLLFS